MPSSKSRGHFRKQPKKIVVVPTLGRTKDMGKKYGEDDPYADEPVGPPAPAPAPAEDAPPPPPSPGPHEHRDEPPKDEPPE
jgi:hypothetical protein